MQGKGNKEEISSAIESGRKGADRKPAAAGISLLSEIIRAIEADTPFSAVRQAYAASLDTLIDLAGKDRDVNLLARYHAILSLLETEDDATGEKNHLIAQVTQAHKMLQDRTRL